MLLCILKMEQRNLQIGFVNAKKNPWNMFGVILPYFFLLSRNCFEEKKPIHSLNVFN